MSQGKWIADNRARKVVFFCFGEGLRSNELSLEYCERLRKLCDQYVFWYDTGAVHAVDDAAIILFGGISAKQDLTSVLEAQEYLEQYAHEAGVFLPQIVRVKAVSSEGQVPEAVSTALQREQIVPKKMVIVVPAQYASSAEAYMRSKWPKLQMGVVSSRDTRSLVRRGLDVLGRVLR